MKKPDEIKRGLGACSADECHGEHADCPYVGDIDCIRNICADALAYIQQLERDNAYFMSIARNSCTMCKHAFVDESDEPCASCINGCRDKWEWRGVEEEQE